MSPERRGRRGTRPASTAALVAEHVRLALAGAALGLVLGVLVGGVAFVAVRALAGEAAALRVLGGALLLPTLLLGGARLRGSLAEGVERVPAVAPRLGLLGWTARTGIEAGRDVGVAVVAPAAVGFGVALLLGAAVDLDDALSRVTGALALGTVVGALPGLALALDRVRRRWTGPWCALGTLVVLVLLPLLAPLGVLRLLGEEVADGGGGAP